MSNINECESNNIASQEESRSLIFDHNNLNHARYCISIYQLLNKLWTSLSLTQ